MIPPKLQAAAGRRTSLAGAIGYNLCFGLFGGTTPLIATYLVARTTNDFTPAYYLMAVTLVSFIVLRGSPETARRPLR